jgi:hypothetical protein
MTAEYDRQPDGAVIGMNGEFPAMTAESAEAARRHAAEIGGYVAAQRWLWHERVMAAHEEFLQAASGVAHERTAPVPRAA